MAISPVVKSSLNSQICIGFLASLSLMLSSVSVAADRQTADAQRLLNNLGYNAGTVDGAWGKKTRTAIEQFYTDRNQRFDGKLDAQELAFLKSEYENFFADVPPDQVKNWSKINGEYRDDILDCRDKQRGVLGVENQTKIKADWLLNNDFGSYIWQRTPKLKSCLYRDGTGWEFNSRKAYSPDKLPGPLPWFAPVAAVGAKGFGSIANMYNGNKEFPIQVSSIKKLDYNVTYTYELKGVSNTHVGLWFSQVKKPRFKDDPDAGPWALYRQVPELEVMLKIGGNFKDDEKWMKKCKTDGVWTRYSIDTEYGKMPACIILKEKNNWTATNNGQFASSSVWFSDGWYKNQIGTKSRQLDLKSIITQLADLGFVKNDWYLMGIEFQTEVSYGKGKMKIHSLDYELVTK
tara:strand:+ start:422 stop:1633 length:1212 start_codon:yes stop_codon:yes gene_type:complete